MTDKSEIGGGGTLEIDSVTYHNSLSLLWDGEAITH